MGEKISFGKFEGGKLGSGEGELEAVEDGFVHVTYLDDEGNRHTCRFRRAPGPKSGWGVGPSKFWRLSEADRKKYCLPDVPRGKK